MSYYGQRRLVRDLQPGDVFYEPSASTFRQVVVAVEPVEVFGVACVAVGGAAVEKLTANGHRAVECALRDVARDVAGERP